MIKNSAIRLFLLSALLSIVYSFHSITEKSAEDNAIFKSVAAKLASLKTISYHYTQEFSYPAEDYHSKSEMEVYMDFSPENDLAGFRYQSITPKTISVFNNSEIFHTSAKTNTISIKNKLKRSSLEGQSALYNSIATLRNILPLIIKNDSIPKQVADTLINNKAYLVLKYTTKNGFPNYVGYGFSTTTLPLTFDHRIIVDQETYLPVAVLQTKRGSKDLNRTDFTAINLNPTPPKEASWYYSSYLDQYQLEQQNKVTIIKPGQTAPEFNLTNHQTKQKESLSNYKNKLVLLEFWIKNCGYCIEAVSKLKTLDEKYKGKNFKLIGINTEDSEKSIEAFISNHKIDFTILSGNEPSVNKNYGISAFPQIVLISKKGTIIYAGDLDIKKVEDLIAKHI